MMRCFVSIDIPDSEKKEILKIQKQLPEFRGKKTEFRNLHLTLKFLGEISEEKAEEVKLRLNRIKFPRFETKISEIGSFDNSRSTKYGQQIIVWLNMTNCEKLQKEIDRALKSLFPAEKRFMGHLTIARVKSIKNKKDFFVALEKIQIPKIEFNVKEFQLKESVLTRQDPEYKTIEEFHLN